MKKLFAYYIVFFLVGFACAPQAQAETIEVSLVPISNVDDNPELPDIGHRVPVMRLFCSIDTDRNEITINGDPVEFDVYVIIDKETMRVMTSASDSGLFFMDLNKYLESDIILCFQKAHVCFYGIP